MENTIRYVKVLVSLLLLSFALTGCVSFSKSDEEIFNAEFVDEAVNQKKGYHCYLKMSVKEKASTTNDAILQGSSFYGRIGLYTDNSGTAEQLGSDFYITEFKKVEENGIDAYAFDLVYAGVGGKRVDVPNCLLFRQVEESTEDPITRVSFGKEWPFSEEYTANVHIDKLFDKNTVDSQDTWYGFSLKKPYAADRYAAHIYSDYTWVFGLIFILASVFFLLHGAYRNLAGLVIMTAVCIVSVVHDWTLAFPVVLPFYAALLLLFIPYISKHALTVFIIGTGISFVYSISGLWHYYGFFLFIWKVIYIGICTIWACIGGELVFGGRCSNCGKFLIKESRRRKEYFAAEQVLSIPLASNGRMSNNPKSVIDACGNPKEEEACYWCGKK